MTFKLVLLAIVDQRENLADTTQIVDMVSPTDIPTVNPWDSKQ